MAGSRVHRLLFRGALVTAYKTKEIQIALVVLLAGMAVNLDFRAVHSGAVGVDADSMWYSC